MGRPQNYKPKPSGVQQKLPTQLQEQPANLRQFNRRMVGSQPAEAQCGEEHQLKSWEALAPKQHFNP